MKVFVLSFREEYLPNPRILVAFASGEEASKACSSLTESYKEIKRGMKDPGQANESWSKAMKRHRIPKSRAFPIDHDRLYNFAFEVNEVELLLDKPRI